MRSSPGKAPVISRRSLPLVAFLLAATALSACTSTVTRPAPTLAPEERPAPTIAPTVAPRAVPIPDFPRGGATTLGEISERTGFTVVQPRPAPEHTLGVDITCSGADIVVAVTGGPELSVDCSAHDGGPVFAGLRTAAATDQLVEFHGTPGATYSARLYDATSNPVPDPGAGRAGGGPVIPATDDVEGKRLYARLVNETGTVTLPAVNVLEPYTTIEVSCIGGDHVEYATSDGASGAWALCGQSAQSRGGSLSGPSREVPLEVTVSAGTGITWGIEIYGHTARRTP